MLNIQQVLIYLFCFLLSSALLSTFLPSILVKPARTTIFILFVHWWPHWRQHLNSKIMSFCIFAIEETCVRCGQEHSKSTASPYPLGLLEFNLRDNQTYHSIKQTRLITQDTLHKRQPVQLMQIDEVGKNLATCGDIIEFALHIAQYLCYSKIIIIIIQR